MAIIHTKQSIGNKTLKANFWHKNPKSLAGFVGIIIDIGH